jgi:cell division protein ZapE
MPYRILQVPKDGVRDAYHASLAEKSRMPDAAQLRAVDRLQIFYDELLALKAARRNRIRKLFINPELPRGVWLWGGVGRGKSFLMDCFFNAVPYQRKRRVHFHAFMREVHLALKMHHSASDPLARVAADIAHHTRLMCFDEFHVSDIADAMILGRLMKALLDAGVVFCITSNYAPDGLYPNGLQRQNFLPTIRLLNDALDVMEIDAGIDYRLRTLEQADIFLVGEAKKSLSVLAETFQQLTGQPAQLGTGQIVTLLDRTLPVVAHAADVIWFDFATLCEGPRSQNDYLALAEEYHTLILSGVPKMTMDDASAARRFTWLVDVLYDHRVKLIISAGCAAEDLYTEGRQASEFLRTVSRLIEMRSQEYLASAHESSLTAKRE